MVNNQFLTQIKEQQLIAMFDLLPDILFWIKDQKGRIVHANKVFIDQLAYKNLKQVIGKTDHDFYPRHIAQQFITDDQKVMTGSVVTDRLELNMNKYGNIAWFSTTKRPVINKKNEIIGTYGVARHLQKTSQTLSSINAIEIPIEFIKNNYQQNINIEQLADFSHLSVSALERRFKKYLGKTPNQFITEYRLEKARFFLLETKEPIAQIAEKTGFSEPSYFSRQFKASFGILPSKFRTQFT